MLLLLEAGTRTAGVLELEGGQHGRQQLALGYVAVAVQVVQRAQDSCGLKKGQHEWQVPALGCVAVAVGSRDQGYWGSRGWNVGRMGGSS